MPDAIWKNEPDEHDFPAAADYLALLASPEVVDTLVRALRSGATATKKAKDLLRATGLPLLAADNPHVVEDLHKVRAGKPLSPVLIVRGDLVRGIPAQIADGYHRVCASWYLDENTEIPCRVVGLDAAAAG